MKGTGYAMIVAALTLTGMAACKMTDPGDTDGTVAVGAMDGTYNLSAAACAAPGPSETRLIVSGQRMTFYESACTITKAHPVGDETAATLSCQGEGETWQRDVRLLLHAEGLRVTEGDMVMDYQRCE